MTTPAWLDELERLEKSVAFGDGLALRRAVPALIAAARREAKMRAALGQIATCCVSPAEADYLSPVMARELARAALAAQEPKP